MGKLDTLRRYLSVLLEDSSANLSISPWSQVFYVLSNFFVTLLCKKMIVNKLLSVLLPLNTRFY